jgi:hypothetical protein
VETVIDWPSSIACADEGVAVNATSAEFTVTRLVALLALAVGLPAEESVTTTQ